MICDKDHRFYDEYAKLPDAQDNQQETRHRCAACAYTEGVKDALNQSNRKSNFSHLPFSQAGTVRHKDVKMSYDAGFELGRRMDS